MTKTQEIITTFFNREVNEDLAPIDYNVFIQDPMSISYESEESFYPTLPQGTIIVAVGNNGHSDQNLLLVKTPDNIFHLVDEGNQNCVVEDLAETPEVDLNTPVSELYELTHYNEHTHYHYTSYTSYTGLIIHLIVDNVPYELGGFITLTKDFVAISKYNKFTQLS